MKEKGISLKLLV